MNVSKQNNLQKRVVLLTGASSGIGFEAALSLIREGNTVLIPCRDSESSLNTVSSLKSRLSSINNLSDRIYSSILDLSDFESIEDYSKNTLSQISHIDTIILNAGLQYNGDKNARRSKQGIELTFAVNHLANQLLIRRLLPLLLNSSKPRIVITSSEVHNPLSPGGRFGRSATLGSLEGLFNKDLDMIDGSLIFDADKAYKDSKLCNILFTRHLSYLLEKGNNPMPVIAWAPGLVIPQSNGGFFRYSRQNNEIGQRIFAFLARDIFKLTETPNNAGRLLMKLATENQYQINGFSYWSNKLVKPGVHSFEKETPSKEAMNDKLANDLWKISTNLVGISDDI